MIEIVTDDPDPFCNHQNSVEFFPPSKDIDMSEFLVVKDSDNILMTICEIDKIETVEPWTTELDIRHSQYESVEEVEEKFAEDGEVKVVKFTSGHPMNDFGIGDRVMVEYQSSRSKNFLKVRGRIEDRVQTKSGHTMWSLVDMSGNKDMMDRRRLLFVGPGANVRSAQFGFKDDVEFGWSTIARMGYIRKRKIGVVTKIRKQVEL